MNKILIISAHPDDDIIGCGGIISKYSKENIFRVIFIAEGSSCRYTDIDNEVVINEINNRNECGLNALKLLGVRDVKFYNLKCGRLDQVPIININKIIENEVIEFSPNIVFTHSDKDANNDHLIVHKSTLMATRPGSSCFVSKLYSYEVLSSSEWRFTKTFKPNFFESISKNDLQKKWNALKEYKSEIKPFPYPRSFEGLESLARYRGMQSNNEYAEAFELIREINQ